MGEAIRVSCQIRKYEPASLIHQPGRTPLGTNLLKDEVEPFRNQSILRTIQLSQEHYQRPTVVFGSGHLAVIGPTLEAKFPMEP